MSQSKNIKPEYKRCKRCVMDTTASEISFDGNGVCNFCSDFLIKNNAKNNLYKSSVELDKLIDSIKSKGAKKSYDCLIGVSGGVDSSWALVQAKEKGLNPLAVHMDNGWNSELAQSNIYNLIKELNIDLFTHVIDWTEYRNLMQSFFDADVIDIEILYDNAMLSVNYNQAYKIKTKFILTGCNTSTEGIKMPTNWNWCKFDKKGIFSLAKRSNININSFPSIGTNEKIFFEIIHGIKFIPFLDYFPYNKKNALKVLKDEYKFKPYPYKHYESIFTRFYQGYILPKKFNVDKRKVHFSNLIITGQQTRDYSIRLLNQIPYPSEKDLEEDKNYFLKKMLWDEKQLDDYISRPFRSHYDYPTERPRFELMSKSYKKFKSIINKFS